MGHISKGDVLKIYFYICNTHLKSHTMDPGITVYNYMTLSTAAKWKEIDGVKR